jgi:hypothetical protein
MNGVEQDDRIDAAGKGDDGTAAFQTGEAKSVVDGASDFVGPLIGPLVGLATAPRLP